MNARRYKSKNKFPKKTSATTKITVITTGYEGPESYVLPKNKANKVAEKPPHNMETFVEDCISQRTNTRWQRRPILLAM